MRERRAEQFHTYMAAILALLLVIMVAAASGFIAAETGHDCSGEDCPICACLEVCQQALEQMGDGIVSLCAVLIPLAFFFLTTQVIHPVLPEETPVSFKVRLNN